MTTPREQPSFDPDDEDLRALFQRTAPEASPTDLEALMARAETSVFHRPKPIMSSRRLAMTIRIAAATMAAVGIAALVSLVAPRETSAAFGLADVRREVKATRTVTFTTDVVFDRDPRAPTSTTTRTWIQSPGRYRFEHQNGYTVIDMRRRRSMSVNTREKTVESSAFAPDPSRRDLYSLFLELAERPAERLAARTIGGKQVLGFVAMHLGHEVAIWVDPATRLPVRIEQTRTELGRTISSVTRDIVFDRPLDDSLFRMDPPPGHHAPTPITITFQAPEQQAVPDVPALAAPTVTPRVGIGPARFGMSREEVIKRLGKPDHEFTQGRTLYLSYRRSRGFELGILPADHQHHGLSQVSCVARRDDLIDPSTEFRGKTDKGIGIGAGRAEIIAAHGEPDRADEAPAVDGTVTDHTTIDYRARGLRFDMFRGKVERITLDVPRTRKGMHGK